MTMTGRGTQRMILVLAVCCTGLLPIRATGQTGQATAGSETRLTLEQIEEMAQKNNPTLPQAEASVRAAAGRTMQAGLWPNPTAGYTGDEIRGGSFGGGEHGAFVQQKIVLGGKLGLDRKVFGEEGKQAQVEEQEQRLRVQNGVKIAFYQSLAAQRLVEIRSESKALAQDAVTTTEQLFNVGQADRPDVLQAEVEADQAELALIGAEQEQARAWRVLAAMAGTPTMPLTRLEGDLEHPPEIDMDQAIQTIAQESPAVKIAELGVSRADAAAARAAREAVPDLFVRAGVRNDLEAIEGGGPGGHRAVGAVGFAEAGVELPIFNRNQGNAAAARADADRARSERQRVALVLRQMAAPVAESYATARAMAEHYRARSLPAAQEAYTLYRERYREGAAAYPQVLIAQRTLQQLEANYVSALEEVWTSGVALQGMLLTDGLDLPAAPGELDRPVREINLPLAETPGARP